jgi:hypothetical protein
MGDNSEMYTDIMEVMDRQIMYGLFASMSLKSGDSVYKGSEEEREAHTAFMETVRSRFTEKLKLLWTTVVVPGYDPDKINVEWSPLRSNKISDIADAFEVLVESGVFIDADERRAIASKIFPILRKRKPTPKEIEKLDDIFIQMKSPSQPGESTVDIVKKNGKNNTKKAVARNKPNSSKTE